jgi:hypothetical protein
MSGKSALTGGAFANARGTGLQAIPTAIQPIGTAFLQTLDEFLEWAAGGCLSHCWTPQ